MKHLICPLCALPMTLNEQGLACSQSHQFDRAKEGYFNLLPVQQKNSREPGDAKEQLNARRKFLEAGYFLPLANKLTTLIDNKLQALLDVGCGEGYFTRTLGEHCGDAEIYGVDIAKVGVRLAAKNAPGKLTYVVASSYSLPIADDSMDLITRIYAPSKDAELRRVLKTSGRLVIVTPGENHLLGIRKKIYRELRPYLKPVIPEGFAEVSQAHVSFALKIPPGEHTQALLQMTPFAWKLTAELAANFREKGITDEADFCISIYEKNNDHWY